MLLGEGARENPDGLCRNAQRPHAELASNLDHQPGDRRMEVDVVVGVDVIERETGRGKSRELRPDLSLKGAANRRQKKEADAGEEEIVVERAVGTSERRDFGAGRERGAADENEMKAELEPRHPARPAHRIGGGRGADHEARSAENAVAMRDFDRLVDRLVETEIVCRKNETLQLAISRLLRN
jgi:hypothetical protein